MEEKYIDYNYSSRLSVLLDNYKAFFAFNKEQYNNYIDKFDIANEKRVQLKGYGGLIALKSNYKELLLEMEKLIDDEIDFVKKHNSPRVICFHNFANHEVQISGDISDTLGILSELGISEVEAKKYYKEYFDHCVKNDYF